MTDVLRPSSERPMRIELAGDIDMANAKSLGDSLCNAIDLTTGGLVVDMTAVAFLDSSAMAMMVRVHQAAVARQGEWLRCADRALGHHFELAWPPGLVEERLERAVEPQDDEPTLLRIGLDPVACGDAVGLGGRDVHDGRAVRFGFRGG